MWEYITSWCTPTGLFLFVNFVIGIIVVTARFNASQRTPQHQHDSFASYHSHPLARTTSLLDRVKSINFYTYEFPAPNPEQETQTHYPESSDPVYDTNPVDRDKPQLTRAPSLLDRVKSINFSLYKFPSHNAEEETRFAQPSERVYDTNPFESDQPQPSKPVYDKNQVESTQPQLTRAPSLLERVRSFNFSSVYRSQQPYTEPETDTFDNYETERASDRYKDTAPEHKVPDLKPKRSKSETKKSTPRVQDNMKKSASEKSMTVEAAAGEADTVERRRPQTARLERTETIGDGDQGVDAKADDFINKFRRQLKLQRLDSLLRYKEMLRGS